MRGGFYGNLFLFFALLSNTILLSAVIDNEPDIYKKDQAHLSELRLVGYAKMPGDDMRHISAWLKKWYKGQTRTELENEQVVAGGVRMALGVLLALKFMFLKRYGWGSKPVTIIPDGDRE